MFLVNPASQERPCRTYLVMIKYTILTPKHHCAPHLVKDILIM